MSTRVKQVTAILVGAAIVFASGLYVGRSGGSKEVVEIKGEEKTAFKDRIVTVTKEVKPDGTTTETIKTEDKQGSSQSKSTAASTKTDASKPDWKVGAIYHYHYGGREKEQLSYMADVQAIVSRRILGPVFLDAAIGAKSVALGMSVEF